jgi:hypothetical protein
MKILLLLGLLTILVSCNDVVKTKTQACEKQVKHFENTQVSKFKGFYGIFDLCDLHPAGPQCACYGVKPLPLSCEYTKWRINRAIGSQEQQIKETSQIIKTLKDKKSIRLFRGLMKSEIEALELLQENLSHYTAVCEQNK